MFIPTSEIVYIRTNTLEKDIYSINNGAKYMTPTLAHDVTTSDVGLINQARH